MALSNWDTLVMNEKSEPINGSFRSPCGVSVEFYKNWLYVRDKRIDWTQSLRFNQGDAYFARALGGEVLATEPGKTEPTVMSQLIEKMK